MSENLHSVDDLFRDALNDHEEEPPDRVWENIDRRLDKKGVVTINKKYRRIKWVAAASLIFTCALATYTIYIRKENIDIVKEKKTARTPAGSVITTSVITQKKTAEELNAKAGEENKQLSNISGEGREGKATNETNNNVTSSDKQQLAASKKATPKSTSKIITEQDNSVVLQGGSTNKKFEKSRVQVAEKILKPGKDKALAERELADNEVPIEEAQNVAEKGNEKLITPAPIATPNQVQSHLRDDLEALLAIKDKKDVRSNDNPANNTIGQRKATPIIDPSTQEITQIKVKDSRAKPSTSKLSATAFFSPDFISAKVTSDKPRFREDDRNEIKRNEETKVSSTVGVLINYNTGKNWSILSGLSYSTRITDITAKTIYARPDNRGGVKYRFNCSAGYTFVDVKSGTAPASGDSTRSLSATNTLHYLNIPIGVQYNIPVGKLSFHPAVSLSANIRTKGIIETVIATAAGNERTNTKDIQGLKSSYFNGAVSVGTRYKITDALALTFMPTARFAFSSINKDAPVKTHFNSIGLLTGLTIKL